LGEPALKVAIEPRLDPQGVEEVGDEQEKLRGGKYLDHHAVYRRFDESYAYGDDFTPW
jgi:hypothetical protein